MDGGDPRVVNDDDVDPVRLVHGDAFDVMRWPLAKAAGGGGLGCSLYELPPGKRDFPYHLHHGNDEAIYVLEGRGTLRLDGRRHPLRAGDFVSLPAGPTSAHQVHNTSDAPLRFLMVSTMRAPDVMVYPDSGKVGTLAGAAPGGDKSARTHDAFYPLAAAVGYWEGE